MTLRYFTVAEANLALNEIKPLVGQLLHRRARAAQLFAAAPQLADPRRNVGGPVPSQLAQEMVAVEKLIQQITDFGCDLKDPNIGLLDFLAERDGRDVYLCWRYGEPTIQYYHELHTGFRGRQRL